jgi:hypothetical protein
MAGLILRGTQAATAECAARPGVLAKLAYSEG